MPFFLFLLAVFYTFAVEIKISAFFTQNCGRVLFNAV